MNQKRAVLLATALTAFLLVAIGGVAGGLAARGADPASGSPATASAPAAPAQPPASQDPVAASDWARQAATPADESAGRDDSGWPGEREHHDEHDDDHDDDDD